MIFLPSIPRSAIQCWPQLFGQPVTLILSVLVEARQALLEALHEPAREALGLGERQLAELGARARDGPAPERRGVEREAGGLELAREGRAARSRRTLGIRRFCMLVVRSAPVP